jgi:sirohydrochlorin cobaltochelatase
MHAIVLIGHGSLRSASGASMIRIAARLNEQGIAPLVEACFLNYSRPTLAEAVEKCVRLGATRITVQPYFLIAGAYVLQDLPALIASVAREYPHLPFHIADAFGAHPAMAELALRRVRAADPNPPNQGRDTGLLWMAHGTPLESANTPLYALLARVQECAGYAFGMTAYLDCNKPEIPEAAALLIAQGARRLVALPYFLHLGRHVREDLPALMMRIQTEHPGVEIVAARHLDYDLLLAGVAADRARAARPFVSPAHGHSDHSTESVLA